MISFSQFMLNEAPFSSPGMLPPTPGAPPMGGSLGAIPPPPGGLGAMPPPPMGGLGGGLGPPIGGPPGMGMPGQQQQKGPVELKSTDVWKVLEELLGLVEEKPKKKPSNNNDNMIQSRSKHLMS